MQIMCSTSKTNKNEEMYTLYLWKVASSGAEDLGYNNIWNEPGSENIARPVSKESQFTKHQSDLMHHQLFPACHLNRLHICMAGHECKEEVESMIYWLGQTPAN